MPSKLNLTLTINNLEKRNYQWQIIVTTRYSYMTDSDKIEWLKEAELKIEKHEK